MCMICALHTVFQIQETLENLLIVLVDAFFLTTSTLFKTYLYLCCIQSIFLLAYALWPWLYIHI